MTWRAGLTVPLKPRDHAPLRTLHDARAYLLELEEHGAALPPWPHAAAGLMRAAESGDAADVRDATEQVYRALFMTARLDLQHHRDPPL